jgi:hypothetical protein
MRRCSNKTHGEALAEFNGISHVALELIGQWQPLDARDDSGEVGLQIGVQLHKFIRYKTMICCPFLSGIQNRLHFEGTYFPTF